MSPFPALIPVLLGFGTGLALIVAIGAQNAYLLRLGIEGRRAAVAPVVFICAISDAILIIAGVFGVGAVIQTAPMALVVVRILGAGFLLSYGVMAAIRVLRPRILVPINTAEPARMRTVIATMVALTWLNPHVYLDTVVFLGSVANQQGGADRWWWAGGAILASFVWFSALGFGARLLRPFFARALSWRILDGAIACVMVALGIRIALGG